MAIELPRRPMTVDEYQKMDDVGIFGSGERVELLDGMLVEMPPLGLRHVLAHGLIVEHVIAMLGDRFFVAGEASIPLGRLDEPQPDVTIFRREIVKTTSKKQWSASDIVAVIEIADSSMRRDRGPKQRTYARGGVAEYLIVDLNEQRIVRFRQPRGDRYESVEELAAPGAFALAAAPEAPLRIEAFFPPA